MWETQVRSVGQEDSLEKEMATHSSTLAWKIPWTEEPGSLQSMGSQRVGHDWATKLSLSLSTYMRHLEESRAFPSGSVQEMRVQSLGQEDTLEKEVATHSSILAWEVPWIKKPGRVTVHGVTRVGHDLSDQMTTTKNSQIHRYRKLNGRRQWLRRGKTEELVINGYKLSVLWDEKSLGDEWWWWL